MRPLENKQLRQMKGMSKGGGGGGGGRGGGRLAEPFHSSAKNWQKTENIYLSPSYKNRYNRMRCICKQRYYCLILVLFD